MSSSNPLAKPSDFDEKGLPLKRDPSLYMPAEQRRKEYPHLYTASNRLENIEDDEVGKWVELDQDEWAQVPKLLTKTLEDPLFMGGHYLMIRKETQDLLEVLREINANKEPNATGSSVGVYGPRGSGKTVLLNMLAVYAVQQDWLLFTTTGLDFPVDVHGFIKPCEKRAGTFRQDRNCVAFFKHHMEAQGTKLKSIQLKRTYSYHWNDPEATSADFEDVDRPPADAPTTLWGLMQQAVLNPNIATDVFYDFVEELKLPTEVPVLVLVDNVNVWDHKSEFRRPDNAFRRIMSRELAMVDAFSSFQEQGPGNGLSVAAMTSHGTQNFGVTHMQRATFAVETAVYSDTELKHAVHHYKATRLTCAEVDSFLLARIKGLTGGVPRDLFFDCALI